MFIENIVDNKLNAAIVAELEANEAEVVVDVELALNGILDIMSNLTLAGMALVAQSIEQKISLAVVDKGMADGVFTQEDRDESNAQALANGYMSNDMMEDMIKQMSAGTEGCTDEDCEDLECDEHPTRKGATA